MKKENSPKTDGITRENQENEVNNSDLKSASAELGSPDTDENKKKQTEENLIDLAWEIVRYEFWIKLIERTLQSKEINELREYIKKVFKKAKEKWIQGYLHFLESKEKLEKLHEELKKQRDRLRDLAAEEDLKRAKLIEEQLAERDKCMIEFVQLAHKIKEILVNIYKNIAENPAYNVTYKVEFEIDKKYLKEGVSDASIKFEIKLINIAYEAQQIAGDQPNFSEEALQDLDKSAVEKAVRKELETAFDGRVDQTKMAEAIDNTMKDPAIAAKMEQARAKLTSARNEHALNTELTQMMGKAAEKNLLIKRCDDQLDKLCPKTVRDNITSDSASQTILRIMQDTVMDHRATACSTPSLETLREVISEHKKDAAIQDSRTNEIPAAESESVVDKQPKELDAHAEMSELDKPPRKTM